MAQVAKVKEMNKEGRKRRVKDAEGNRLSALIPFGVSAILMFLSQSVYCART